ncbi:Flavoprotein wrbA [Caenispirillum salinarum AK4]|uniref:NAD(P)H dehydrogenase (quinone) n=1 Tax=Caenispirillum salinarum AK4 TaxID=1238182 RepID=K9HNK3_9PROT|nr:NAD(P)H:quinone oxidoreductase [Caenispirillum salinarum]EKV30071.1 Flavoprotein wrbA [Caenispirillum salinarum AK4]
MTKVLVLYYSAYGHIATMARAAADGARTAGADVTVLRVPETLDEATRAAAGIIPDPEPVAVPADLPDYDAILFGTPTHFGTMAGQMKAFLDSLGGLWARNALVGKAAGVFTSSQSQHGGQEHTLLSTQAALLHLGMVIVGLPYTFTGQTRMDEITGGSPYGATTLAGGADGGSRTPSATELDGARFQGRHVAEIAAALATGRPARSPVPA